MSEILTIKNAPLGKWPSRFMPALMQQVAINFAINKGNSPLFNVNGKVFSVNGPPGTGKTTLLKEIVVNNVIERAILLAQYTNPNDAFVAQPGDIIMYDWGDSGKGDCIGWPDHVGLVVDTDGTTMTIVEGNKAERVGIRKLKYNSKNIRGFIVPKYVDGATQTPKPVKPIETAEYKARVTASALWVRAGASTKCGKVGCLRQNTIVNIYEVRNNWGRINKSANMWISLKYTAKL